MTLPTPVETLRYENPLRSLSLLLGLMILQAACTVPVQAAEAPPGVSIIVDPHAGAPAGHGLAKIVAALKERGIGVEAVANLTDARGTTLLLAGIASHDCAAVDQLKTANVRLPSAPEALVERHLSVGGRPALVLVGSDARGLMYAELDVAQRIGWAANAASPFSEVRDVAEAPDAPERAISVYTMNRAYWESRFYDTHYWDKYFDTLAENRFDSFVLIFGYENGGFLAPPYPYFFDVDGYPDVRMVGITPGQQAKNLSALNRLIEQAHARGIRVTVGIWDHIYRGGVQGGGIPNANDALKKPTPGLVWGVSEKNLIPYTQAALAKLIKVVPKMDGIQFRMHDESGLKNSEQVTFWTNIFAMMKEQAPHLHLDLRAKGLQNPVIDAAVESRIPFRITTKYWMEQMGMPWHPTHINPQNQHDRRHSYADLLVYPQRYRMHWRLWNGGTARVLLWGDPDYVQRFVKSTHLYDGDGFEVNEPLCTKMEAQPHDATPFALMPPKHQYYEYEFERYWHFFQVFGRLGYNPQTPSEVWDREFIRRFGPGAGPLLEQALHEASWVLPRIVASSYPYSHFPMTRGWAEKQHMGSLPRFAMAQGTDVAIYANFDEEARNLLEGNQTPKVRPEQTSRWFDQRSRSILALVSEAEKQLGDPRSREAESTLVDLKMLAQLAAYHARRIPAAISYRLYQRTGDIAALNDAIAREKSAIDAWQALVADAGDFYADDLMMGVRGADLCGHWRDELQMMQRELIKLEEERNRPKTERQSAGEAMRAMAAALANDDSPVEVGHEPIQRAEPGRPLAITATVQCKAGVKWVRVRYRSVNQMLDYQTQAMEPTGQPGEYRAVIPADQIKAGWDFMYYLEIMNGQGDGRIWPDPDQQTPYMVVRVRG